MDQLKFSDAEYLVVILTVFQLQSATATGCKFVLGIPGGLSTVDKIGEKVIDSDYDIGETIIRMELRNNNKRKRRHARYYSEDDVMLINSSSQFGLRFNGTAPQHEIFLKSCPAAGQKETLQLGISDERDSGKCPDTSVTISILATTPRFDGNSTTEVVSVDLCAVTISVLNVSSLILNSPNECEKQWNCTANCTNDEKLFWIQADMVLRTYTNNVDNVKTYDVEITCVETGNDQMDITSGNMKYIEIMFREYLTSCPTITSIVVMRNSNLSLGLTIPNEGNTKSLLEDMANVVALSSVGGLAAGGAIGTGVYFMTKKQCSTKKQGTRESEETGDLDHE